MAILKLRQNNQSGTQQQYLIKSYFLDYLDLKKNKKNKKQNQQQLKSRSQLKRATFDFIKILTDTSPYSGLYSYFHLRGSTDS
jgi:hypothetical protein